MEINDQLVLPPVSAKKTNLTCHFCIVGCGYHVYKWPEHKEGGKAPSENAFNLDYRKQIAPLEAPYTVDMHNVVTDLDGSRHNIAIVPDKQCSVNQGISSARGGSLAKNMYTAHGVGKHRLKSPSFRGSSGLRDCNWEEAVEIFSSVIHGVLKSRGPNGIFFDCFDHGGAGGGFENTWATGKLMFSAIKTEMVRIHNRPAYNSECHATRDMGISELNNSYEDAQLADTIFAIGCNSYETQTNYFLNHWLPNLKGETVTKKKNLFGAGAPGFFIFVDPRKTVTISIAESVAPERVLHLDILPGTDTALFNGLFTYVIEKGWIDARFIEQRTDGFELAKKENRISLSDASRITGVSTEKLEKAAQWAYQPKPDKSLPRTMHAYEKGIIWGYDNYRIQSALVNLVLATKNVGRRGTGVVRMGGHQEGYARPPYPGSKKINVDQEIIAGNGSVYTAWGANPFRTTLDASRHRSEIIRRAQIVSNAVSKLRGANQQQTIEVILDAVLEKKGLFFANINLYPTEMAEHAHLMLPAAHPGEMNHTSMNGERRLRLTEKFMDPPGLALPDCLIAGKIGTALFAKYNKEGNKEMQSRFSGFEWKTEEDAFNDGFRMAGKQKDLVIESQGGDSGHLATYENLRRAGNNGVQLPISEVRQGKLIGTEMLYQDEKFSTPSGKAKFLPSPWLDFPEQIKSLREKHRYWINNGRVNELWQSQYHDEHNPDVAQKAPVATLDMSPEDCNKEGFRSGDLVEIFNEFGSAHAAVRVDSSIKSGQTFMVFAHYNGNVGNLVTPWTDKNMLPWYKGTWASIKLVSGHSRLAENISFKERGYPK
jgi:arsenite oxidase large subunit